MTRKQWIEDWLNFPADFESVMADDKPGLAVHIENHSENPIPAFDNKPFIIVTDKGFNMAAFKTKRQAVKFINDMGWMLA